MSSGRKELKSRKKESELLTTTNSEGIDWMLLPYIDEWYCKVGLIFWEESRKDEFDYSDLREVLDAITKLGYSCKAISNGNFVLVKENEQQKADERDRKASDGYIKRLYIEGE